MNAREKLEAERISGLYTQGGPTVDKWRLYQSKLRQVLSGVDTYWLDKPLQTSLQQRHTVTLEGGDEALRYRLYVGYNHSPGVMKGSKRDVLTGALDFQYRLPKVLLKNSIAIDNSTADESPWGSFDQYTQLNPYLRPYGENGELLKHLDNFSGLGGEADYLNPMYNTTFNSKDRSKNFSVRELFKVEYTPLQDLRFEAAFSLSKSVGNRDKFRPAQHTAFDGQTDPTLRGDYRRSQSELVKWGVDLTGSWNKQLADHYITANARMSVQEHSRETYGNYVTGFPNDNMDNLLFGKKYNEKVDGIETTSRSIGWVVAGGYSYKYKYSVDFNLRLDGSSEFGKDNRWAPFWSTGLRWDVKKESLLANLSWLSDFVLRVTYGTTGSQGFNPYQAHGYYTYANLLLPYYSSDATGSEILAMHNEKLKWQTTRNLNFGLELGALDHRLTARVEYYRKVTSNMITMVSLAPSVGFAQYPENIGKLENRGWELTLSAIPYRNVARQSYWTVTLNGSHNTDKLLEISEAMRHINEVNAGNLKNAPLPRYEEGQSVNRIWVVRSLGIDPASGNEILLKRNGEMTSAVNWDAKDAVPVGNTEPTWQGHINTSFTYMGWGIDVSMMYRFGGQVYNQTLIDKVENANLKYNADRRVTQLRWLRPGDRAMFREISPRGSETKATSRFVMDENVLQGSSLSLYYRMDRNNTPFIKRVGVNSARLAFNMEDFFYLSTVKRERGTSYPFSRQFIFSLNVGF
jgi:putative outer membrane protein, probably involved in nutrient binding